MMSNINDRCKKQHEQIIQYEKIIQEKSQLICEYKDKVDDLRKMYDEQITHLRVSKDKAYHTLYVEKEKIKDTADNLECKNNILNKQNVNLKKQIKELQENNKNKDNYEIYDDDDNMKYLPYVIMICVIILNIGVYQMIYNIINSIYIFSVSLILTLIYMFSQKDIQNIHVLGITLSKHKPSIWYSNER